MYIVAVQWIKSYGWILKPAKQKYNTAIIQDQKGQTE